MLVIMVQTILTYSIDYFRQEGGRVALIQLVYSSYVPTC